MLVKQSPAGRVFVLYKHRKPTSKKRIEFHTFVCLEKTVYIQRSLDHLVEIGVYKNFDDAKHYWVFLRAMGYRPLVMS